MDFDIIINCVTAPCGLHHLVIDDMVITNWRAILGECDSADTFLMASMDAIMQWRAKWRAEKPMERELQEIHDLEGSIEND